MNELEQSIREVVRDELRRLTAPPADEYMSTVEAAKHAKVVPATIRRWVASGKLREHHAGRELRISRIDLERMLKTGHAANDSATPEQRARRDHG